MAGNYYSRAKRSYGNIRKYGVRSSAKYFGGRAYARAKGYNETIGLYNPGVEYLVGVGVGVTNLDNRIPAVVKILGAALPLRGGIGGKVCRFFRGMLIGDAISHYTGVKFNVPVVGVGDYSNIKWG